MQLFRRWARLPSDQKLLTLQAGLFLLAARVRMSNARRAMSEPLLVRDRARRGAPAAATVASTVERVAACIPWETTCLSRALAARALLAWHGVQSQIIVGAWTSPNGTPLFHAWLTVNEIVVIGERDDLGRFQQLLRTA